MNTRRHLDTLFNIISLLLILCIVGVVISLLAAITGEGIAPLLICAGVALSLYVSLVLLSTLIDFYDTVVLHQKIENRNFVTNSNTENPQDSEK